MSDQDNWREPVEQRIWSVRWVWKGAVKEWESFVSATDEINLDSSFEEADAVLVREQPFILGEQRVSSSIRAVQSAILNVANYHVLVLTSFSAWPISCSNFLVQLSYVSSTGEALIKASMSAFLASEFRVHCVIRSGPRKPAIM